MYIGEFQHNMDDKNRVFIPAKLRETLGERFVVCNGVGDFLTLYSVEEWEKFEAKINALPQMESHDLKTFFFSGANEVKPDAQGRVVIPQNLKQHANLTRELVITGASNRAEIWNAEAWHERKSAISIQSIKEKMALFGL